MKFDGQHLTLNYATSASGSVEVELQDETGQPLTGYMLADSIPMFGDELNAAVKWQSTNDVSSLTGKCVRLHFVLKDADLFALRFAQMSEKR